MTMWEEENNDIPKYTKKTSSNTSKSNRKSKHKHHYEDCLLIKDAKPYKARYCCECGKIDSVCFFISIKDEEHSGYRVLTDDEVFEKYKDISQFYVEDIWCKYVTLSKEIEN